MPKDLETRRNIPTLVNRLPLGPHILHDTQGSFNGPKHFERAHLAHHLAEHVLLAWVRQAPDDAKGPDDGAQAHGAVERVEQVDGDGDAGGCLRTGGLPSGHDGREVG